MKLYYRAHQQNSTASLYVKCSFENREDERVKLPVPNIDCLFFYEHNDANAFGGSLDSQYKVNPTADNIR